MRSVTLYLNILQLIVHLSFQNSFAILPYWLAEIPLLPLTGTLNQKKIIDLKLHANVADVVFDITILCTIVYQWPIYLSKKKLRNFHQHLVICESSKRKMEAKNKIFLCLSEKNDMFIIYNNDKARKQIKSLWSPRFSIICIFPLLIWYYYDKVVN